MAIVPSLPYTIQNGQPGDATQVMADLNSIVDGVNQNGAHNGANSDITSISGLTTPLSVPQGGTGVSSLTSGNLVQGGGSGALQDSGIAASSVDHFASGTKMVFKQASAPTGWTQDTSTNDKVLRIVSGIPGADGGSWTISGLTVDGHTLTAAEVPNLSAPLAFSTSPGRSAAGISIGGAIASTDSPETITTNTGGGGAHAHGLTSDGTWRPAYSDVLVASKD